MLLRIIPSALAHSIPLVGIIKQLRQTPAAPEIESGLTVTPVPVSSKYLANAVVGLEIENTGTPDENNSVTFEGSEKREYPSLCVFGP